MKKEMCKMALSDIKPYENNPRNNQDAIKYVVESIQQCGNCDPIEIDENNIVLSGHTRLEALKQLNYNDTECIKISGLTDEQKNKYRLLANKTAEFALWDFEKLQEELDKIDFGDFDFGFYTEEEFNDKVEEKPESSGGEKIEKFTICPCCGMKFVPILTEE